MLIKNNNDLKDNHVTDHSIYKNRRKFMKNAAGLGLIASTGGA